MSKSSRGKRRYSWWVSGRFIGRYRNTLSSANSSRNFIFRFSGLFWKNSTLKRSEFKAETSSSESRSGSKKKITLTSGYFVKVDMILSLSILNRFSVYCVIFLFYFLLIHASNNKHTYGCRNHQCNICLLYTSDAADEEDSVDLGGRRIIKKK